MRASALAVVLVVLTVLVGCGSRSPSSVPPAGTGHAAAGTKGTSSASKSGARPPSALQAEATSAASGDIPDNQVFLTFHDGAAGYSMKYPEGWAQQGSGATLTFRDKNNIVRVVV